MESDNRISVLHALASKYALNGIKPAKADAGHADDINTLVSIATQLAEKLDEARANERNLGLHLQKSALATKQFEENRLLFTSIVNLSDDAIISKDLSGIITSWNSGAQKIFGYSASEITGKHISTLIPSHLQKEEFEIMEQIKNGQNVDHYKTQRLTKDGNIIHVSLTISPVKDLSGHIIGASKICRDITTHKKAEEELQRTGRLYAFLSAINKSIVHHTDSQTLLRNACNIAVETGKFESARIGLLDEAGRLIMVNTREVESGGVELQRYSGTDFSSHLLRDTPTGKVLSTGKYSVSNDALNDPHLSPWKKEMEETGIRSCASFPLKKFGKTIGVFSFLSAQKSFFDDKEIALLQESADDISFALEVIEKDNMRKRMQDEIITINSSLESKIAERTVQLQSANQDLESFSYSVAHDLRSPLRGINGYATILNEDYNTVLDDEGKRLLGEIKSNANKMGKLIDELLTLSKIGRKEIKMASVDMNRLMKDCLAEITRTQQHNAEVYAGNLQPVIAEEGLLRHVISNLLSNAIKYSSKNPKPVIEIKSQSENGQVVYSISDNGVGFDMRYVDKLFGVFQRLHGDDEFEGTGVGLAIAHRIIHKHGGKIWALSAEGKGATFYFSLPVRLPNTEKQ